MPQIKKIYVKSGKPVAPLTRHAEMTVLGRVKKLLLQPSKKLIAALLVLALLVIAANIVSVITKKDQTDNTPDNFYSGLSDKEHRLTELIIDILRKGPARTPSLHDVESADAVFSPGPCEGIYKIGT